MTRSEFGENLKVAWDTLRTHKVRSSLTLLGIVIGVTSVIATASVIDGLEPLHSAEGGRTRLANLLHLALSGRHRSDAHARKDPAAPVHRI